MDSIKKLLLEVGLVVGIGIIIGMTPSDPKARLYLVVFIVVLSIFLKLITIYIGWHRGKILTKIREENNALEFAIQKSIAEIEIEDTYNNDAIAGFKEAIDRIEITIEQVHQLCRTKKLSKFAQSPWTLVKSLHYHLRPEVRVPFNKADRDNISRPQREDLLNQVIFGLRCISLLSGQIEEEITNHGNY